MKNLWHSVAPFATDTTGACTVFANAPALVIAQDSNGTVAALRRAIDIHAGAAQFETIDLPELSFMLGRERDFQDRMIELYEMAEQSGGRYDKPKPKLVVLVGGPVSNLLGTDLRERATQLENRLKVTVLSVQTTGNRYYDRGIEQAYEEIYEHFARDRNEEDVRGESVNLLGLTQLDYPGTALLRELEVALIRRCGDVISDLGFTDNMDAWRNMTSAGLNVVMSTSGLKLARRMKAEHAIPFVPIHALDWLDEVAQGVEIRPKQSILIVGEQITSNLLRRLLRICGVEQVDVASFFTFDSMYAEVHDVRLAGESDLVDLLEKNTYDLVVGDGALSSVCRQTRFMPLMHAPTGFGKRDGTELSNMWLRNLAREIDGITD